MSIALNKKIEVNGVAFTLEQLIQSPNKYMPYIRLHFMSTTLIKKNNETDDDYYSRLFRQMYYAKGFGVADTEASAQRIARPRRPRRPRQAAAANESDNKDEAKLLNTLGINIIKKSPVTSKISFKNFDKQYRIKNADIDKLIESIKSSKNISHQKLDVSFGVELEFIGERGHTDSFGSEMVELLGENKYVKNLCYNHNTEGNKWILGTDGSLKTTGAPYPNSRGYELTSPIMHFTNKDFSILKKVIALVNKHFKAFTNTSCGTHVHMSFTYKDIVNEDLLRHLCASYKASEENLFDKLVPLNRRGNRSRWCRSTSIGYIRQRYQKLNVLNTEFNSKLCHVEFRQLDGTLDFDKLKSWIKLQKLFLEIAMQNYPTETNYQDYDSLKLEEVIFDKSFDSCDVESLFKMSNLLRAA